MSRILIVNADDFNLTRGVDRAILECHDKGIVSSTTFMANLETEEHTVRELKKRKRLGVGIHLNVTFRFPVLKSAKVKSLLKEDGAFRKVGEQLARPPKAAELAAEYSAQIERFIKTFGRKPTHLDTHHQVHNHPFFLDVLAAVAHKFQLPIRSSCLMLQSQYARYRRRSITQFFFGNLTPEGHWTRLPLETVLENLPEGRSEIMCHPGVIDADLKAVSSFTKGRDTEHALFSRPALRKLLELRLIKLAHYGV